MARMQAQRDFVSICHGAWALAAPTRAPPCSLAHRPPSLSIPQRRQLPCSCSFPAELHHARLQAPLRRVPSQSLDLQFPVELAPSLLAMAGLAGSVLCFLALGPLVFQLAVPHAWSWLRQPRRSPKTRRCCSVADVLRRAPRAQQPHP
jgi:hypothetical protein